MTNDELKLNCIRVACDVLGIYSGSASYTGCTADGKLPDKPSVHDVLTEAKQLYEWASKDDA